MFTIHKKDNQPKALARSRRLITFRIHLVYILRYIRQVIIWKEGSRPIKQADKYSNEGNIKVKSGVVYSCTAQKESTFEPSFLLIHFRFIPIHQIFKYPKVCCILHRIYWALTTALPFFIFIFMFSRIGGPFRRWRDSQIPCISHSRGGRWGFSPFLCSSEMGRDMIACKGSRK